MELPIRQMIDHDASSDKLVIHFSANLGNVSMRVSTSFKYHETKELKEYKQSVVKVFNAVYKDHTEKMVKRQVK